MVKLLILLLLPVVLLGCSNTNGISTPDIGDKSKAVTAQDNHWSWGVWEFSFHEDHTQVEAVPQRAGQYHYCVTKLMEEYPCPNCLVIGQPTVQPDGTVKLKVTLRHPFPSAPKYTGFDVRGMVYFPPTAIYPGCAELLYEKNLFFPDGNEGILPDPYSDQLPIIFSRADQGGGELLNADGYSCYILPGATYSKKWPIYSYSPPKYSNEPAPFSTINPYKLFASDIERRMFLVTDKITREYHFALPPGPFNFGYAVDASWWPPTKTPVTNPAIDFPREANAEDPWLIEYEQLLPICAESVGKDIFKITVHHRGISWFCHGGIWVWDLSTSCPPENDAYFTVSQFGIIDDFTSVGHYTLFSSWWNKCQWGIVPGHHLALLILEQSQDVADSKAEMRYILAPRFVDIYVK